MPSKKSYKKKKIESERIAKRTVQIIGFGSAGVLLVVRIIASVNGVESGISEFFIAAMVGVGVSGEINFKR